MSELETGSVGALDVVTGVVGVVGTTEEVLGVGVVETGALETGVEDDGAGAELAAVVGEPPRSPPSCRLGARCRWRSSARGRVGCLKRRGANSCAELAPSATSTTRPDEIRIERRVGDKVKSATRLDST